MPITRAFVTGGAGFIGSNMVAELLARGVNVVVYDNLCTGQSRFLPPAPGQLTFVQGDLLDTACLNRSMAGCDFVFHYAANADVRFGTDHPTRDLEQNTIATSNVLEAMRLNGVSRILFTSTGSVYGEPEVFPTPETAPFPVQTSLYGASKLAGEALIQAYCNGFGFQAWIFRLVSMLGPHYTHGHVFDFVRNLQVDPTQLHVLGNGHQRKSYLYIKDCIAGQLHAIEHATAPLNILNIGSDEACEVNDSIGWICAELEVDPVRHYSGGQRGWIGDCPFIHLDCSRLRALGWQPTLTIREAVVETVRFLVANPWVFEHRD